MDWTYLVESADLQKPWKGMSSPLPIVKSIATVAEFYLVECQPETCPLPQSATTSQSLAVQSSHTLTSSTEASPAKTSASQVVEGAWKASEAAYLEKSCAWPKNSSPSSYSLKTSQTSAQPDSATLLSNWPIVGMTVGGFLYPLKKSEPHISERDGFFWPTPTARANRDCPGERRRNSLALEPMINFRAGTTGGKMNPNWVEWLMGYPTTWTVVEPWAMPSCQRKRGKRLKDLAA